MPHNFDFRDYKCTLSADYPVAGSVEQQNPTFMEELTATGKLPRGLRQADLVSWILARLTEVSYGALPFECVDFASDGGDFAYGIKVTDADGQLLGYWGFIFWPDRIALCGHQTGTLNGQTLIVQMLTGSPRALGKCEVTIRNPDARTKKTFGWDGYQYL